MPQLSEEEINFVSLVNRYRAQNGLQPLQVSVAITNAAKWMSEDMAQKNYFSHTDSLGRDPFVRMAAFGYDYPTARGENIAAGHATAINTFNQWRCSPGHNANMLNRNYRVIGIAKATGTASQYRYFWTSDFGGAVDHTMAIPEPANPPQLPSSPC